MNLFYMIIFIEAECAYLTYESYLHTITVFMWHYHFYHLTTTSIANVNVCGTLTV